jgi:hypothetical protein
MTSAREEADVISLYAWFTADNPQNRTKNTSGVQPGEPPETLSVSSDDFTAPQEQSLTLAAAELGVSVKTVRRAIKSGRLPARLIPGPHGPEYRVDVTELIKPSSRNQDFKREKPEYSRRSAKTKSQTEESEELVLLSQRINVLEDKINRIIGN